MGIFGYGYIKTNNEVDSIDENVIMEMGFEDIDEELLQESLLGDAHTASMSGKYKVDIKEIKAEIKANKKDPKAQIKSYEKLKKVLQDAKTKLGALDFSDYRVRVSVSNFTSYLNSDIAKYMLFGMWNSINNAVEDDKYRKAHQKEFPGANKAIDKSGTPIKVSLYRVIDKNIDSINRKISQLK